MPPLPNPPPRRWEGKYTKTKNIRVKISIKRDIYVGQVERAV